MSVKQALEQSTSRITNLLLGIIVLVLVGIFIRLGNTLPQTVVNRRAEPPVVTSASGRYQLQRANENNIFLIDTQTGKVWRQFVDSSGGPTEWSESDPVQSSAMNGGTVLPSDRGTAIKN